MIIRLNGTDKKFSQTLNLDDLVREFGRRHSRIIAEVNGHIIARPHWDAHVLKDGDQVELVGFVGGG